MSDKHVPAKKVGGWRLLAVVRDPIDHFLSGWAECGSRKRVKDVTYVKNTTYDNQIRQWLSYIKLNDSHTCRPHSQPQSSYLLFENRTIHPNLTLVGDLSELPGVLKLSEFEYNPEIKADKNASIDKKYTNFPKRKDLLSNTTLKELCGYLALDYYLFNFEPPKICKQVLIQKFITY